MASFGSVEVQERLVVTSKFSTWFVLETCSWCATAELMFLDRLEEDHVSAPSSVRQLSAAVRDEGFEAMSCTLQSKASAGCLWCGFEPAQCLSVPGPSLICKIVKCKHVLLHGGNCVHPPAIDPRRIKYSGFPSLCRRLTKDSLA